MKYFKQFLDDDGYIYSLDMVRLNIDFGNRSEDFIHYMEKLSAYDLAVDVQYFSSFKPFQYRHLWTVSFPDQEISFALGMDINGSSENRNKGFMEFNPNKCENCEKFVEIKNMIFSLSCVRDLVRYDLAIDIPLDRKDVKLIRTKGKNYQFFVKDDGITEYLGVRSHSGYIKVYDKQQEAKLNYPCTRIEITLDSAADYVKAFPKVWLYDTQYHLILDDSLSSTQKTLIKCLRQCENPNWFLGDIKYEIKKKIEPYLCDKVLSLHSQSALNVKMLALSYT